MIESNMVSPHEGFTKNTKMSPEQYVTVKQPISRKPLRQFTETFYVKPKNYFCRLYATKSKFRAIKEGSMLWYSIPKLRSHKNINKCVRIDIYKWILHHTQVVQYPIANDCLKLYIDEQSEQRLIPKILL